MIDKHYNPKDFENTLYKAEEPYFIKREKSKKPYCIMMPPPNVTGNLHLGHALTYTLQDILIRFKRMQGFDAFWQPGLDHAGIAMQMVVERNLESQGIKKIDLTRDQFIEKGWENKKQSGDAIHDQQKKLCIAASWPDNKFTLDPELCESVKTAFVKLYEDGLIYKDKRLVNWDTHFKTAISDLEVVNVEEKGSFWYVRYPFVDDTSDYIVIATTRPETMFADQAIAVHPDDDRYKHLIGKYVHLPLTDKTIPIIADEYCDMEKGSGAVKITPAHDFNDFEVGKRHNLERVSILDFNCHLNENVPFEYQGLDVKSARKKVVEDLEKLEFIDKIEQRKHTVPYGDRSNIEIQPLLTEQWFLNTEKMAKDALAAVENDVTKFIPKQWENTYFDWLKNIQPWCISRQLWWGHQVPAWYGPDHHIFVAMNEDDALQQAHTYYGKKVALTQDTDILDTWFSSALWPFSTLGWPSKTEDLEKYYPTAVLITGFDIIFFWVARMMMMGLYFMKQVPFKDVYIHALIRDAKGQKMSKSKGNVIDPLVLIDKFGVDALRFTLSFMSTPGRDIKLSESIVDGHRHFITKIWNSARFLQMNDCILDENFDPKNIKSSLCRWLVHDLSRLIIDVTAKLESYRFDLFASALHQWFWGEYCAQFLESMKVILASKADESLHDECRQTALYGFLTVLKLLHPVAPMVTEHLWKTFCPDRDLLINIEWPEGDIHFETDYNDIQSVFAFAAEIRSLKGLLGIDPVKRFDILLQKSDAANQILKYKNLVVSLGRLKSIDLISDAFLKTEQDIPFAISGLEAYACLGSDIDHEQLKLVVQKKHDTLKTDIDLLSKKISNENYKKAKYDVWQADFDLCAVKNAEFLTLQKVLKSI